MGLNYVWSATVIMETCVEKRLQRKTKSYINVFYVAKMAYTMGEGDKKDG